MKKHNSVIIKSALPALQAMQDAGNSNAYLELA